MLSEMFYFILINIFFKLFRGLLLECLLQFHISGRTFGWEDTSETHITHRLLAAESLQHISCQNIPLSLSQLTGGAEAGELRGHRQG